MGAELQALGKKHEAFEIYSQGYHFSEIDLGQDHPLTQKLRQIASELEHDIKSRRLNKQQNQSYLVADSDDYFGVVDRNRDFRLFQNANNAFGLDYTLDQEGIHKIKFDKMRNEVSIDKEPPRPLRRPNQRMQVYQKFIRGRLAPRELRLPAIVPSKGM
jgi:hypothetical protein